MATITDPTGATLADPTGAAILDPAGGGGGGGGPFTISGGVVASTSSAYGPTIVHTRIIAGGIVSSSAIAYGPALVFGADIPLALGPTLRSPAVNGPRLSIAGTVPPAIAAFVYRPTDIGLGSADPTHVLRPAPAIELTDALEPTWQDRLDDIGTGSLVLANTDARLADVHDGDLVRFELFGEATMSWFVADREQTTLAADGAHAQVTKLSGPAHISILGQSLVYPSRAPIVWPPPPSRSVGGQPIEEDRVWNWTAVDYFDDAWIAPAAYASTHGTGNAWTGLNDAWPPDYAEWLWAPGYSLDWAPSGTCYFRRTFTLPATTNVILYAAADDQLRLWIDGQLVVARDQWSNVAADMQSVKLVLEAGSHVIAAAVGNSSLGAPLAFNPAAFACYLYEINIAGGFDGLVVSTNSFGSTWKMVAYPPGPPATTAGAVLLEVLAEANTRRGYPQIVAMFDHHTDSDGNPWVPLDEVSTKVGNDMGTMIVKEMTSAGMCDVWMEPGSYGLWAWNPGRRPTSTATLHSASDPTDPASGNLAGLVHHRVT